MNKTFNTANYNTSRHKYPTRSQKSVKPREQHTKHTHHSDIRLSTNKHTGRGSQLEGFLQHAYSVWDASSQKMLEFKDLIRNPNTKQTWNMSYANELGCLSQGIRDIKGTNCIFFIPHTKVPHNKKVTYGKLVVDFRPTKSDPN